MARKNNGQDNTNTNTTAASEEVVPMSEIPNSNIELDQSFLDIAFEEVPEMEVAPEGEYELLCERAKIGISQGDDPERYVLLYHTIPSVPTAPTFSNYFGLGKASDSETRRNEKLSAFRKACVAHGVSTQGGVNMDDFSGKTAWANVVIKEDPKYGTQNNVKGEYRSGR